MKLPPFPSKWVSRKQGTRHVYDHTLGGMICYFQGRYPRYGQDYMGKQCSVEEWVEYAKDAKRVGGGERT